VSYKLVEYDCPGCGPFESLEPRAEVPDAKACPHCGTESPLCLSPVYGRVE
jgi:putative FmdB family regulatory protein